MKTLSERRQFRRAELDVTIAIRPLEEEDGASNTVIEGKIKNVSLAGALCYVPTPCPLKTGQAVICSVTIPLEQARIFPFARINGKGWIVRIAPVAAGRRSGDFAQQGEQFLSVAVAFAPAVTALGTLEHQF